MKIKQHTIKTAKKLLSTHAIMAMRNKEVTQDQFKFFVKQKNSIAMNFQRLLEIGIKLANQIGDVSLANVLQRNLSDEQGVDENGQFSAENSHNVWRHHFLAALEIKEADLHPGTRIPSAQYHMDKLLELEQHGNIFNIIGAILMTERVVPLEYRAVQISRNHCFPEQFLVNDTDDEITVTRKNLASKYIDNHILHDAQEHYPDLLRSLEKYEGNHSAMHAIKEGVSIVTEARSNFFEEVLETQ